MGEGAVRAYRIEDRAAVRRICFETGYMGDPVGWLWRDQESFADLFSAWYTDCEPDSAQVATLGDEVVGYLLGCRDSRRVTSLGRVVGRHVARRGLLVRPGTAPVLWRGAYDLVRAAAGRRRTTTGVELDRHPAHLHIDLLPEARGHGLGARLVEGWLDALRAQGVPGCHLETWAENDGAVAFFRAMGFRPQGEPVPMPGVRSVDGHRHHTLLMVQDLA